MQSPQLPATTIIIGPTAGGKSALAVAAAQLYFRTSGRMAEIVSADSILIYRDLNIGAAKPTIAEMGGIAHHLIDIKDPTEAFSVQQWLELAEGTIARIRDDGRWPIVVGGTHLYVKALLDGLFEGPAADMQIRERLGALPLEELHRRLEAVDPAAAAKIHTQDVRRTIRALEVHELTGVALSAHQTQWDSASRHPDRLLVGLEWPTAQINGRINQRVRSMVEAGLVEEARALFEQGRLGVQSREALGYKQLIACFEGRCSLEEAIERIKIETRRFAKNQRTWARRLKLTPNAMWLSSQAEPERWPQRIIDAAIEHAQLHSAPTARTS